MAALQARGSDLNLELEPLKVYQELHDGQMLFFADAEAEGEAQPARVTTNEEAAALPEVTAAAGQRARLPCSCHVTAVSPPCRRRVTAVSSPCERRWPPSWGSA